MSREKVVLDVGANIGDFGLEVARRNPDIKVHLIEPIPELVQKIEHIAKKDKLKNVEIHELCLATTNGKGYLNIINESLSSSSILEFNKDINKDPFWKRRKYLAFNHTRCEVQTSTLETLIEKNNIENIDFIKVDTQGLDVDILKSAGEKLYTISAGMLEAPTTKFTKLYEGETYDLQSALNWLTNNNFEIMKIKPNDSANNECNIFFCKNPDHWSDLISDLQLKNLYLFDGKDYWHQESNLLERPRVCITEKEEVVIEWLRSKWIRRIHRFLKPILKSTGLSKLLKI